MKESKAQHFNTAVHHYTQSQASFINISSS